MIQTMMAKEVQKRTAVTFLLIAIILATIMTLYILNYFQTSNATKAESKESASGGEISLTVKPPPIVRDESKGDVSLTVSTPGG